MLLVLALVACVLGGPPELEVGTSGGRARGRLLASLSGRSFLAFSGLPYARPPLGPRRFTNPEKAENYAGVLDATKDPEDCFQDNHFYNQYPMESTVNKSFVGSEDCLYINVYTPDLKPSKPLPVMVFIHGGGFMIGSGASNLHGPQILMDRDIVLVSFNYRLGVFGFLSVDDEVIPGNIGLKDQVAALTWIKENIVNFGGDPTSITIFGESAGGVSVHLQMLSPLSRGLFQRGISQSGTADTSWGIIDGNLARERGQNLLKALGCPIKSTEMLLCLQSKSAEEIASVQIKEKTMPLDMWFRPVIEPSKEGSFLTKESIEERSELPWISGVTSGDGIIWYGELLDGGDKNLSYFNEHYRELLPEALFYSTSKNKDALNNVIKEHYLGDKNFSTNSVKEVVELFSDRNFYHGLHLSSRKHRGPLYQYLISYMGKKSFSDLRQIRHLDLGVDHADDLIYLFYMKKLFPKLEFSDEDFKVCQFIVDLWVNFASNGDPTPEGMTVKWTQSEKGKFYADIHGNGLSMKKGMFSERMQFWDNLNNIKELKLMHEEL